MSTKAVVRNMKSHCKVFLVYSTFKCYCLFNIVKNTNDLFKLRLIDRYINMKKLKYSPKGLFHYY